MAKVLFIPCVLTNGKKTTFRLPNPKVGLTKAEITTAFDEAIANQIFIINGEKLQRMEEPYIVSTDSEVVV